MDPRKIVFQETAVVAVGEVICTAAMIGIFALLSSFDRSVLLGGIVGCLMGKAIPKRFQDILYMVCGVSTLFIAITGALEQMLRVENGAIVSSGSMLTPTVVQRYTPSVASTSSMRSGSVIGHQSLRTHLREKALQRCGGTCLVNVVFVHERLYDGRFVTALLDPRPYIGTGRIQLDHAVKL